MSAIYTIWLRTMKRYIRSKSRIIGSLGMPIFFLLILGFGLNQSIKVPGNTNYIDFIIPGIIAMSILFTAVFSGIQIIWDKQFGFLKETLVAPVSRFEIMLGQTIGGATTAVIQGLLVYIISFFLGATFPGIFGLLMALGFMILIGISFTALGIVFASRMNDMQAFPIIMNFVIFPLFLLSGALFPLDKLPSALKFVVDIDPLTYGVEGLRYALLGFSQISPLISLAVLIGFSLLTIIIGAKLFQGIQI